MSRIGHAARDEYGRLTGGSAGDQTGAEVFTRTWYDRPWNCVLRFRDPEKRERAAEAMEAACVNDHIGYDQNQRNTLHAAAREVGWDLARVAIPCETDCSALVTDCCIYAGICEDALFCGGNCATTRTLRERLLKTGEVTVLTAAPYLTSPDYLLRGDILLCEGHHTAINLSDGRLAGPQSETDGTGTSTTPDPAEATDPQLAGAYRTVTDLHLRSGAGIQKESLTILEAGIAVNCDGHYTATPEGAKWLLVAAETEAGSLTGYCSKKYLRR